ncbi:SRPBCC domain-containing protein [Streptomyces sp. NPDC051366]|uniref:SRPBCC domain-containing protein n=1 Tax=Streptomyces sp. NPDC051366 TaxID=3365652 RepID=UPI003798873F
MTTPSTPSSPMDTVTLERHIAARPETVFGFFTDREKWLSWMGADGVFSFEPGGSYRNEAFATDDPLKLMRLFGITAQTAMRYVAAAYPERTARQPR